ncbi:MAG: archaemetzincin family Zn-dependent metalloprotease [Bacteroidales bacterium]|nr:archaemetzincin family Zn-dependent metalloprotease [Bacteroidales bacterium]
MSLITPTILLINYGDFEKNFLQAIARDVDQEFHLPVSVEEGTTDLEPYFDSIRRQYNANGILKSMDSDSPSRYLKQLGLFRVDLFIPILTYIFGQALLNGPSGIASLYRLRNEVYGMAKDEDVLRERFTKVVIHELGHAFGLVHCHHPACVMRSSTYVEDIDQKSRHFCSQCRITLEKVLP